MTSSSEGLRIGVLVSGHGRGTNLQAIIDACISGAIPAEVAVVIGTRSDAPALERARIAGIKTVVISPRKYEQDEQGYASALLRTLEAGGVGLICLAGYMRILPIPVVEVFRNRIMNVHPALLPLFGGQGMYGESVHKAVLESGMKLSGATVHFVDEHYDAGPIIHQLAVPLNDSDTPETLAARVLKAEHQAYTEAIGWFAEGRLTVEGRKVRIREEASDG